MALTNQQDIPNKPTVSEPWTFKKLLSFNAAVTNLSKVFVNPLEVLLGFVVLVIGLAILFGRTVPVLFYGLALGFLFETTYERLFKPVPLKEEKKSKK
jgi:hypothetical protein